MLDGLKGLVASAKGVFVLLVLAMLFVLVLVGRLDVHEFVDVVKLLTPAWMAAHAVQSGAEAFASRPPPPLKDLDDPKALDHIPLE